MNFQHSCSLRMVCSDNVINVKLKQYMSLHTTSFLKIVRKTCLPISRVKYKLFFASIHPLKLIIRQYPTNSRVSEPKNLHLNTAVVPGIFQNIQSSFDMLQ